MIGAILYHTLKNLPAVLETLINKIRGNPFIYKALLVDETRSTLGMERTKVMSMEGMEATHFNSVLSGVPREVENQSSDALKEAFYFS